MKPVIRLLIGLLIFASVPAHASLLLEPSLGYEMSTLDATYKATSTDVGGKVSGVGFGLRAGYHLPLLWLALDYSLVSGAKYSGNASGFDGKLDRSNLYFDVGVDLPVLLRVWAGYGLMNSAKYKPDSTTSGVDGTFKDGFCYKLGAGFTGLPFVSVNLEYFQNDFKKYEASTGDGDVSSLYSTFKDSGWILSASLPLSF